MLVGSRDYTDIDRDWTRVLRLPSPSPHVRLRPSLFHFVLTCSLQGVGAYQSLRLKQIQDPPFKTDPMPDIVASLLPRDDYHIER
jgi:hypothetical protein